MAEIDHSGMGAAYLRSNGIPISHFLNEPCAYCDKRAETEGLRASLSPHRGGWRHAAWCSWERGSETECTCGLDDLRRLLATPAAEPGLDVERLEQAIKDHDHIGKPSEDVIACGRGHVERCADAIAAEYARLRQGPEKPEDE